MKNRYMSKEQKSHIINSITAKTKDKSICNCENPHIEILNGHYFVPLLTASLGNDPTPLITLLCNNCGKIHFYSQNFLGIKTR
ncbi:MAG TPA: hypothetical protein VK115_00685 [Staphylococcus sp.]|nr:hypothetical protein [Staphylococcus sp.]